MQECVTILWRLQQLFKLNFLLSISFKAGKEKKIIITRVLKSGNKSQVDIHLSPHLQRFSSCKLAAVWRELKG